MSPLTRTFPKRLSGTPQSQATVKSSQRASTIQASGGSKSRTPTTAGYEIDLSDDASFAMDDMTSKLPSLLDVTQEQEEKIFRLETELAKLRASLAARPTEDDLEDMRKEWQTSEDLFSQSQKDNEQKHANIEVLKTYVKSLETKLEETLGIEWRDCCDFVAPNINASVFTTTTPLPKPSAAGARNSTTSAKRSSLSRTSRSMGVSVADAARLRDLPPVADKTTPTSALRKLEGIRESPSYTASLHDLGVSTATTADMYDVDALVGSAPSSSPAPSRTSFVLGPRGPSPALSTSSPHHNQFHNNNVVPAPSPSPQQTALAEQVAALMTLMKALPGTVAGMHDSEREEHRERIEGQKAAMLDLLDAAEMRADAREMRLQGLLAEAKTASGQMGW